MEVLKDVGRFRKRKGSRFFGKSQQGEKFPHLDTPVDKGMVQEILAKVEKRLMESTNAKLAEMSQALDQGRKIAMVDPSNIIL